MPAVSFDPEVLTFDPSARREVVHTSATVHRGEDPRLVQTLWKEITPLRPGKAAWAAGTAAAVTTTATEAPVKSLSARQLPPPQRLPVKRRLGQSSRLKPFPEPAKPPTVGAHHHHGRFALEISPAETKERELPATGREHRHQVPPHGEGRRAHGQGSARPDDEAQPVPVACYPSPQPISPAGVLACAPGCSTSPVEYLLRRRLCQRRAPSSAAARESSAPTGRYDAGVAARWASKARALRTCRCPGTTPLGGVAAIVRV